MALGYLQAGIVPLKYLYKKKYSNKPIYKYIFLVVCSANMFDFMHNLRGGANDSRGWGGGGGGCRSECQVCHKVLLQFNSNLKTM